MYNIIRSKTSSDSFNVNTHENNGIPQKLQRSLSVALRKTQKHTSSYEENSLMETDNNKSTKSTKSTSSTGKPSLPSIRRSSSTTNPRPSHETGGTPKVHRRRLSTVPRVTTKLVTSDEEDSPSAETDNKSTKSSSSSTKKLGFPSLRKYSSATSLRQQYENNGVPRKLQRSLSTVLRRTQKPVNSHEESSSPVDKKKFLLPFLRNSFAVNQGNDESQKLEQSHSKGDEENENENEENEDDDEENENENEKGNEDSSSIDSDSISTASSNTSQVSTGTMTATKLNKFFDIFNGGNGKGAKNKKRKKYHLTEIMVSSEVKITSSDSNDSYTFKDGQDSLSINSSYYSVHETLPDESTNQCDDDRGRSAGTDRPKEDFLSVPSVSREGSLTNEKDFVEPSSPGDRGFERDTTSSSSGGETDSNEDSHDLKPLIKNKPLPLLPPVENFQRSENHIMTKNLTEPSPLAQFPKRLSICNSSDSDSHSHPPPHPLGKKSPSLHSSSNSPISAGSSIHTLSSDQPFLPNRYIYGICGKCKKFRTGFLWCQSCYPEIFQRDFHNWTSECETIDVFIRDSQLYSNNLCKLLEWIPFEKFKDLQWIGKGRYNTTYWARWIDGRIVGSNQDDEWERTGENDVALKIIHDSQTNFQEFLNEFGSYQRCTPMLVNVLSYYGISKDPFTKEYIMVMEYVKDGNLKDYLRNHFMGITWTKRVSILYEIAQSLKSIHEAGLIHKNLHSGNIFHHGDCTFIGDLGLCPKFQCNFSSSLYKVMTYAAPETLKGGQFTMASDVYGFAVIMYEVATFIPPHQYHSDESDTIFEGIPSCYVELMTQCWSQHPKDRPNVDQIVRTIEGWKFCYDKPNVKEEFNNAEQFRLRAINQSNKPPVIVNQ